MDFTDEMDGILSKRKEGESGAGLVCEFLQTMDGVSFVTYYITYNTLSTW